MLSHGGLSQHQVPGAKLLVRGGLLPPLSFREEMLVQLPSCQIMFLGFAPIQFNNCAGGSDQQGRVQESKLTAFSVLSS